MVSDQDFLFAVDVSGEPASDQMVADLARTVLGHVGYANSAIDALSHELRSALAGRVAEGKGTAEGGQVIVRFRSDGGQLEIIVAGAGRPEWRTTWPLPAS